MSGEARLTKKVKELEGQLLELAAISNNTVIDGSFTGDSILKAANLMDICQRIYKDLAPPAEDPRAEEAAEVVEQKVEEPEAKASNE